MPGSHIPRRTTFRIGVLCLALISVSGCKDQTTPTAPTPPQLKITALVPTFGRHGARIVLVGQQFSPIADSNHVFFFQSAGVNVAAHVDSVDSKTAPTKLFVTVPDSANSGKVKVIVGKDTAFSDSAFVVVLGQMPVISGMIPTSGTPGTLVTIKGSNFETNPANIHAWFGSVAAIIRIPFKDSLQVIVPGGASTGPIKAVMNYDTLFTAPFTYKPFGHSISSFTPAFGWPGVVVTISGSNFLADTTGLIVAFGGVPAMVKSVSTSQIVAVVPVGAMTAPISISYYGDITNSAVEFRVTPAPKYHSCAVEVGNFLAQVTQMSNVGPTVTDTQIVSWSINDCRGNVFYGDPSVADTLLFRGSYDILGNNGFGSEETCSTSDTMSIDSARQMLLLVDASSRDSNYYGDYKTMGNSGHRYSIRARNIPLHELSDGSAVGEVRGSSMLTSLINMHYDGHSVSSSHVGGQSGWGTSNSLLLGMTDSSYIRVTLKP